MKNILFFWTMSMVSVTFAQNPSVEKPIYELRDYESRRISSYDSTGANDDGNWTDKIKPGDTRTIAEAEGPGIFKHI